MATKCLINVYWRLGCMSILVSTGSIESVMNYYYERSCFVTLLTFAMQENIEQWYAIKFCLKLKKSATDSLIEAYGGTTLLRTIVFK